MTRILFEESIPQGTAYFSALGEASPFHGPSLDAKALHGTDYLAVRSTTKVNEALLSGAGQLKLVTTATAGTNHLDKTALEQAGVPWRSAGGCNAVAVAEYVVSVLMNAHRQGKLDLSRITVGVVGAGHVGSALAERLHALNIAHVLCDPPLEAAGDSRHFTGMDTIMTCDVITLHVPFVKDGPHPTVDLLNAERISGLRAGQLLINACRGEVIDEPALLTRLQQPEAPLVVLDVFSNEPEINQALLPYLWFATPHIAGHSVEGKLRGTQMAYEHVCEAMGVTPELTMEDFLTAPEARHFDVPDATAEALDWDTLSDLILSVYDVSKDDGLFRRDTGKEGFLNLRKHYPARRECSAGFLRLAAPVSEGITEQLSGLGFQFNFVR